MVDLEDLGKAREDAWFHENERKLIEAAKARHEAKLKEAKDSEREKLRQLHWMKCPKCGGDMEEIEYVSIKIDKCKECEGVFFDAGELDELMLKKQEDRKSFFRQLGGLFK